MDPLYPSDEPHSCNPHYSQTYTRNGSLPKSKENSTQRRLRRRDIRALGIDVLPYAIQEAEMDPELIPLISEITDGALQASCPQARCLEWWKEQRAEWELPPVDEKPAK